MNYVVDKVKGGVKRGCVHFDTPSFVDTYFLKQLKIKLSLLSFLS